MVTENAFGDMSEMTEIGVTSADQQGQAELGDYGLGEGVIEIGELGGQPAGEPISYDWEWTVDPDYVELPEGWEWQAATIAMPSGWSFNISTQSYTSPEGIEYDADTIFDTPEVLEQFSQSFSPADIDELAIFANEKPEDFLSMVQELGRKPETAAMMLAMGLRMDDVKAVFDVFQTVLKPGMLFGNKERDIWTIPYRREYSERISKMSWRDWNSRDAAIYGILHNTAKSEWKADSPQWDIITKNNPMLNTLLTAAQRCNYDVTIRGTTLNGGVAFRLEGTDKSFDNTLGLPDLDGNYIYDPISGNTVYAGEFNLIQMIEGARPPRDIYAPIQSGHGFTLYVNIPAKSDGTPVLTGRDILQQSKYSPDYYTSVPADRVFTDVEKNFFRYERGLTDKQITDLANKVKEQGWQAVAYAPSGAEYEYEFAGEKGVVVFDDNDNMVFRSPTGKETVIGKASIEDGQFKITEGMMENGKFVTGIWKQEEVTEGQWRTTGDFIKGEYTPEGKFVPEKEEQGFLRGLGTVVMSLADKLAAPARAYIRGVGAIEELPKPGIEIPESARVPFETLAKNEPAFSSLLAVIQGQFNPLREMPLAWMTEQVHNAFFEAISSPVTMKIVQSDFYKRAQFFQTEKADNAFKDFASRVNEVRKQNPETWKDFTNSSAVYFANKIDEARNKIPDIDKAYDIHKLTPLYLPWAADTFIENAQNSSIEIALEQYRREHPMESMIAQISIEVGYDPLNYLLFMGAPIKSVELVPQAVKYMPKAAGLVDKLKNTTMARNLLNLEILNNASKELGALRSLSNFTDTMADDIARVASRLGKLASDVPAEYADDFTKTIESLNMASELARSGTVDAKIAWGISTGVWSPINDLNKYFAAKQWFRYVNVDDIAKVGSKADLASTPLSDLPMIGKLLGWTQYVGFGSFSKIGKLAKAVKHSDDTMRVLMTSLAGQDVSKLDDILRVLAYADDAEKLNKLGYVAQNQYGRTTSDLAPDMLIYLSGDTDFANAWRGIKENPLITKAEYDTMTRAERRAIAHRFFTEQERRQSGLALMRDVAEQVSKDRYGIKPYATWRQVQSGKAKIGDFIDYTRAMLTFNRGMSMCFLSTPRFMIRNIANNYATALVDGVHPFSRSADRLSWATRTGRRMESFGYSPAAQSRGEVREVSQGISLKPWRTWQELSAKGEGMARETIWAAQSQRAERDLGMTAAEAFPFDKSTVRPEFHGLVDQLSAKIKSIHQGGGTSEDIARLAQETKELLTVQYFEEIPENVPTGLINQINDKLPSIQSHDDFVKILDDLRGNLTEGFDDLRANTGVSGIDPTDIDKIYREYEYQMNIGYPKEIAWANACRSRLERDEYMAITRVLRDEYGKYMNPAKVTEVNDWIDNTWNEVYWSKYANRYHEPPGTETMMLYDKEITWKQYEKAKQNAYHEANEKIINKWIDEFNAARAEASKSPTAEMRELYQATFPHVELEPEIGGFYRIEHEGKVYAGEVLSVTTNRQGVKVAQPKGAWEVTYTDMARRKPSKAGDVFKGDLKRDIPVPTKQTDLNITTDTKINIYGAHTGEGMKVAFNAKGWKINPQSKPNEWGMYNIRGLDVNGKEAYGYIDKNTFDMLVKYGSEPPKAPRLGSDEYIDWFNALSPEEKIQEQLRVSAISTKWYQWTPIDSLNLPEHIQMAMAKKQAILNSHKYLREVENTSKDFWTKGGGIPELKLLNETERRAINRWIKQHADMDKGIKGASDEYGHSMADLALHDYSKNYDFDAALKLLCPWEFWITRSAAKWLVNRTVQRPYVLGNFSRVREQIAHASDTFLPERLKDRLKIAMPGLSLILPEWAEGEVYIDPLRMFLPITEWMDSYIDREMADTQIGKVATVMQNSGLSMSPALFTALATAGAFGNTRKDMPLSYTPPEEILMAITGLMPTLAGKPTLGLRAREPMFWDYYVERALNGMVEEGKVSREAANEARLNKSGVIYKDAQDRAITEYHLRRSVGVLTGFPLATYPSGERLHRERIPERLTAGQEYKTGVNPLAWKEYYEKYPTERNWNYPFMEEKEKYAQVNFDTASEKVMNDRKAADDAWKNGEINLDRWYDLHKQADKESMKAFNDFQKTVPLGKSQLPWVTAANKLNEIDSQDYYKEKDGQRYYDAIARERARNDYLATLKPEIASLALTYENRNKTDLEIVIDAARMEIARLYDGIDTKKEQASFTYVEAKKTGKNTSNEIARLMTRERLISNEIRTIKERLERQEVEPKVIKQLYDEMENYTKQWADLTWRASMLDQSNMWVRNLMANIAYHGTYVKINTLTVFPEKILDVE